ncbi:hypothetical protein [Alkaliphilus metalliredigens]|uniref:hypothetical protein n=1 Tax=Alkaliphilus metalliredigens TaxID=208226 RepID=UPI0002E42C89|nr:hypothetical protein [Alkaliphilus metalliredigens]
MEKKHRGFIDRWFFYNSQSSPELRHEYPLHDISDNLHFGKDPASVSDEETFMKRRPQHEGDFTNDEHDKFS